MASERKHRAKKTAPTEAPARPNYSLRSQWGGLHWPMSATADYTGELSLTRVPLNSSGYDRNGRYYGSGPSLFDVDGGGTARYEGPYAREEPIDIHFGVRAADRASARALVRQMYPNAKILR